MNWTSRILVDCAAPTNVMALLLTQKRSETLRQQINFKNKPGAGCNMEVGKPPRSGRDCYTILVASSSHC